MIDRGMDDKLSVGQRADGSMLNRRTLALYCLGVVAAYMVWVVGEAGLGPIDDHYLFRTHFPGKGLWQLWRCGAWTFFSIDGTRVCLGSEIVRPLGADVLSD